MTRELLARRGRPGSRSRIGDAAALLGLVASAGCVHPQGSAAPGRPLAEATASEDHACNCAERIAALEAQIRRLRAEVLASGRFDPALAAAQFRVDIVNATSHAFVLVGIEASIDGVLLYHRSLQAGSLADTIPAWAGVLPPGPHAVRIHLRFAGNAAGSQAPRARQFDLSEEREVSLLENRAMFLTVRAYERGGAGDQHLAIAWDLRDGAEVPSPSGSTQTHSSHSP